MSTTTISQIQASQFSEQVTSSTIPVLVEFFTDRCSHCQALIPILEEVSAARGESLRVFKFDAGQDPAFASNFRIRTVPNLILFQNGSPIAQRSGFAPTRELLAWVDTAVQ